MERGSATPGERHSAQWVAGRLRQQGAEDIRLEPFPYQGTFAYAQAAHFGIGLLAALGRRRLLAAAALVSFELEYSGRRAVAAALPAGRRGHERDRAPAGPRRGRAHCSCWWHITTPHTPA